mmetsp:Transcript_1219/g.3345  ORF Transcript_1219/g.3345 Transcript_1219/m.3345 type:complete len:332 (+) Transcript_1219:899-1894(+)
MLLCEGAAEPGRTAVTSWSRGESCARKTCGGVSFPSNSRRARSSEAKASQASAATAAACAATVEDPASANREGVASMVRPGSIAPNTSNPARTKGKCDDTAPLDALLPAERTRGLGVRSPSRGTLAQTASTGVARLEPELRRGVNSLPTAWLSQAVGTSPRTPRDSEHDRVDTAALAIEGLSHGTGVAASLAPRGCGRHRAEVECDTLLDGCSLAGVASRVNPPGSAGNLVGFASWCEPERTWPRELPPSALGPESSRAANCTKSAACTFRCSISWSNCRLSKRKASTAAPASAMRRSSSDCPMLPIDGGTATISPPSHGKVGANDKPCDA